MPPFAAEMLRNHEYFVGRWSELNQLCQVLEQRTPALLMGARQSGRSSLLYHFVHAASALFDHDTMRAYYIDLAEFPDIAAVRATVAAAFAQQPAHWQRALLELPAPPLLAFDNCDAPQLADTIDIWWQELLPAVRQGQLRCVAVAQTLPLTTMPWQTVPMRSVDGTMLTDMVEAQLGDTGLRLDRDTHVFLLKTSRGNVGHLMAGLRLWYHHQQHPQFDWRAVYAQLPAATTDAAAAVLVADAGEWVEVDEIDSSANYGTSATNVPTSAPAPALEFPTILVVIAGLCLLALLWWWVQRVS